MMSIYPQPQCSENICRNSRQHWCFLCRLPRQHIDFRINETIVMIYAYVILKRTQSCIDCVWIRRKRSVLISCRHRAWRSIDSRAITFDEITAHNTLSYPRKPLPTWVFSIKEPTRTEKICRKSTRNVYKTSRRSSRKISRYSSTLRCNKIRCKRNCRRHHLRRNRWVQTILATDLPIWRERILFVYNGNADVGLRQRTLPHETHHRRTFKTQHS